ncbi:MAG TPA: hypothetical protein VLM11_20070 [Streptosporangiaceae bacterium]|nr:hypothetical protein [Streptosporangiaceae bacterium]
MSDLDVVLGVSTRTGSAVIIALARERPGPAFAGRWDVPLISPEVERQAYHSAADLTLTEADDLVRQTEQAAEGGGVAALRAAEASLQAGHIGAVAVVVKAVSVPASTAQVLRSHAWMHAAEGVLYREAMLAAARKCGWTAHAVDSAALTDLHQELDAIGRAAGRPWRRIEKDAAAAALHVLRAT